MRRLVARRPDGETPPHAINARRLTALLVIGLTAGVLSGLLGVGGGLISVPAMVVLLSIPQREAHATSLAAIGPTALTGAVVFGKASSVELGTGVLLALGAIVGVQVGAAAMRRATEPRLRQAFGVLLFAMALVVATR